MELSLKYQQVSKKSSLMPEVKITCDGKLLKELPDSLQSETDMFDPQPIKYEYPDGKFVYEIEIGNFIDPISLNKFKRTAVTIPHISKSINDIYIVDTWYQQKKKIFRVYLFQNNFCKNYTTHGILEISSNEISKNPPKAFFETADRYHNSVYSIFVYEAIRLAKINFANKIKK